MPRTQQVNFRATDAEQDRWKKASGTTDLSKWIRSVADQAASKIERAEARAKS